MVTASTLIRMFGGVTLEQVVTSVEDLTLAVRAGFEMFERRLNNLEARLEVVEVNTESLGSHMNKLDERLSRVESALYNVQNDIADINEEIHGIHRVIDNLNMRLTRVERTIGFLDLPEPDPSLLLF